MPRAWRIIKRKFSGQAFNGEGSRQYGSRWTSRGHPVAFAVETLSLAVLEVLVHLQSSVTLADYVVFTVEYSDRLVEDMDPSLLPSNWRDYPAPPADQVWGDAWIRRSSSGLLRAPSAFIPHEHNLLINPAHNDFAQLLIGGPVPFDVDPRVFRRGT